MFYGDHCRPVISSILMPIDHHFHGCTSLLRTYMPNDRSNQFAASTAVMELCFLHYESWSWNSTSSLVRLDLEHLILVTWQRVLCWLLYMWQYFMIMDCCILAAEARRSDPSLKPSPTQPPPPRPCAAIYETMKSCIRVVHHFGLRHITHALC